MICDREKNVEKILEKMDVQTLLYHNMSRL
jgi:hypothetical protein